MKLPFLKYFRERSIERDKLAVDQLRLESRRLRVRIARKAGVEIVGEFKSAFRGTGLTFTELAEYEPGDDIRSIYWPASARSGRVYVKRYQEERSLRIMILLDISASMYTRLFRQAANPAEIAALICFLAKLSGDGVGLIQFSDLPNLVAPVSRSKHTFDKILKELSTHSPSAAGSDIAAACDMALENLRKKTVVFVISDMYSGPYEESLSKLAARHSTHFIYIGSNFDLPKDVGLTNFRDPETGEFCEIDLANDTTRKTLRDRFSEHEELSRKIVNSCGASFTKALSDPTATIRAVVETQSRWRR